MDAKPRRRYLPRFSLRTLLIVVLVAASAFGLWYRWDPWVVTARRVFKTFDLTFPKLSPDRKTFVKPQVDDEDSDYEHNLAVVLDAYSLKSRFAFTTEGISDKYLFDEHWKFSRDSSWIMYTDQSRPMGSGNARIFNLESGARLLPPDAEDEVTNVQLSRDSNTLLLEFKGKKAEVWNLKSGNRLYDLDYQYGQVFLSPNGSRVAKNRQTTPSSEILILDARSGIQLDAIGNARALGWFSISENILYLWDEKKSLFSLYDVSAKKILMDIPSGWNLLGTADGNRLICSSKDRSSLLVCDRWSEKPGLTLKGRILGDCGILELPGIRLNPDRFQADFAGSIVTVWAEGFPARIGVMPDRPHTDGGGISRVGGLAEGPWKLSVCEWNLETGKPNWLHEIEIQKYEYPDEIEYSNNGGWVKLHFGGSMGGSPCDWVWKNESGSSVTKILGNAHFSPSGRYLLVQTEEHWDWILFELGKQEALHDWSNLSEMRFLDDDTILAGSFGNQEYELVVWQRRRPEGDWGLLWLPEFWLTILFGIALIWSLRRDWKTLRGKKPEEATAP